MAAFRTWLIAGFAGALCVTLWLGAFAMGSPRWWHLAGSAVTFTVVVVVLAWKFRPSQVAHAVPASAIGYAIGWDVVRDQDSSGWVTASPWIVAVLAVALATVTSLAVARYRESGQERD